MALLLNGLFQTTSQPWITLKVFLPFTKACEIIKFIIFIVRYLDFNICEFLAGVHADR